MLAQLPPFQLRQICCGCGRAAPPPLVPLPPDLRAFEPGAVYEYDDDADADADDDAADDAAAAPAPNERDAACALPIM